MVSGPQQQVVLGGARHELTPGGMMAGHQGWSFSRSGCSLQVLVGGATSSPRTVNASVCRGTSGPRAGPRKPLLPVLYSSGQSLCLSTEVASTRPSPPQHPAGPACAPAVQVEQERTWAASSFRAGDSRGMPVGRLGLCQALGTALVPETRPLVPSKVGLLAGNC